MIFRFNNLDFKGVLVLDFWWLISKLCYTTSELDCWTQFAPFPESIDSYNKLFWNHKFYRNSLAIRSCYEFFICGCSHHEVTLINRLIQVFTVWTNFSYAVSNSCILLVLVMVSCKWRKGEKSAEIYLPMQGTCIKHKRLKLHFFSFILE